jgi:lipid-binding SYLF domain-containing protein
MTVQLTLSQGGLTVNTIRFIFVTLLLAGVTLATDRNTALAASAKAIDQDATIALERLYATNSKAKDLGQKAAAILVFPKIVKAGLVIGGSYGEGVLRRAGKTDGYYSSAAASYGLQAGAQSFGYVMFFMNEKSVSYLKSTNGWEIGAGPSVVMLDNGIGKKMSSTTLTEDVYAIIFNQSGMMAGMGLEGSKLSKISR